MDLGPQWKSWRMLPGHDLHQGATSLIGDMDATWKTDAVVEPILNLVRFRIPIHVQAPKTQSPPLSGPGMNHHQAKWLKMGQKYNFRPKMFFVGFDVRRCLFSRILFFNPVGGYRYIYIWYCPFFPHFSWSSTTSDPQWHFLRMSLQSWTSLAPCVPRWCCHQGTQDTALTARRNRCCFAGEPDSIPWICQDSHWGISKGWGHHSLLQQTCKHDNFATFGCMRTSRTVLFGWTFSSCLPNPASIVFASSVKAFVMACAACRKDKMALTRVDGLLQWMIFPAKARINSRLKRRT